MPAIFICETCKRVCAGVAVNTMDGSSGEPITVCEPKESWYIREINIGEDGIEFKCWCSLDCQAKIFIKNSTITVNKHKI